MVKELRDKTGAGMMDCKKALAATSGDLERAVDELRKKGLAAAQKKSSRTTREGAIDSYIHAGGKLGVLIEVNCESDFVARTEDFQELLKDIAMHIAASDPRYLRREEVPAAVIEQEKEIAHDKAKAEGKPEKVLDKIVEGSLAKFYETTCLLDQPFVKDPEKTIDLLRRELVGKLGENIEIKRFARFRVGDEVA